MIACGTSVDELAGNRIMLMELGEPFDIRQWMRVDAKMAWELEYDTHLCDMQPFESKNLQQSLVTSNKPGTYCHAPQKTSDSVLRPTQTLYQT